MKRGKGKSYAKRVAGVNEIYERYSKIGLSNREIWRRHIYPVYGISERTFYNLLKASANPGMDGIAELSAEGFLVPDLSFRDDEARDTAYYKKNPQ